MARRVALVVLLCAPPVSYGFGEAGGAPPDVCAQGVADHSFKAVTPPGLPAHVRRGGEVEARHRAYRARLARFFARLIADLKDAPALHAKFKDARPASVPYGYQGLPKIVPDAPRAPAAFRPIVASFGWRHTETLIERDEARLAGLEAATEAAPRMPPEDRRREWERIGGEYLALARAEHLVESHIQYNRFWQEDIHRRRAMYDDATVLYETILERQAIHDALRAGDPRLAPERVEREQALLRRVRGATDRVTRPSFVAVEHPEPHRWILRVPVFTDIDDGAFVEAFREAVETAWRVRDGEDEFGVAIEIRQVPPARLYAPGRPPESGERIDLDQHVGRFPPGGAVLTTGASLTHVGARWSIRLGPHDITPTVLAHEFGHVLGLPDGYFRGYRDHGPEGYQVLEVAPDPEDIMSAPGRGRVRRQHFDRLVAP